MSRNSTLRSALGVLALCALAACGGGHNASEKDASNGAGGASEKVALNGAEGLYTGTSGNGQAVTGLVLDNGDYWVMYSEQKDRAKIAGVVQGRSVSSDGKFTSSNGRDFNFEETDSVSELSVLGTYSTGQSISGNVVYGDAPATSFKLSYDARYEQPASLASLAGSYLGESSTLDGDETASFTVTDKGAIVGSGISGCRFTGMATPRGSVAVFDLSLSFSGSACSSIVSNIEGVAYVDPDSNRLLGAAMSSDRRTGAFFAGKKIAPSLTAAQ